MRLPPGSSLRRRMIKRWAVRGWDAVGRGDYDVALSIADRDYELNVIGERSAALGFESRYRGHAGMKEFTTSWRTAWSSQRYQVQKIFDLGDVIAMRFTNTTRGQTSGVELSMTVGSVYFIEDGTIVRQDFYWDWDECAATVGLDD
jgi:ketosteroid isomerase-like protein